MAVQFGKLFAKPEDTANVCAEPLPLGVLHWFEPEVSRKKMSK